MPRGGHETGASLGAREGSPAAGAVLSLVMVATLVPEGLGKLLDDDRIVVYRRN